MPRSSASTSLLAPPSLSPSRAPSVARPAAPPVAATAGYAAASLGTVAVIGLGLIGGSVARDLAALGVRVLGHDRDADVVRAAHRAGAVDAVLGAALEGVEAADVVLVAAPVDEGPRIVAALAGRCAAARLVTDVGSTKRGIVDAAEAHGLGTRFVGAHPLAGDHRWGWPASRRGLFAGARVYLCPAAGVGAEAMALADALWRLLGATPECCDAAGHDELLAWSSHLPQVAATALALTLQQAGVARASLGPGGRDTTRLAGSSPALWAAIARDNAAALATAVEQLERQLGELRAALQGGDAAAVLARFGAAHAWFATEGDATGATG
ncbi:MAG TPA: prephenate dehydrogenase [Gemmatimonadaceae bacterium]|nr:prephenate dehydrogenase [Gemmatimonadaceae bacterium]